MPKKGPTSRRRHKLDDELHKQYARLYEELGRRNVELAEAQYTISRLKLELEAAQHVNRILAEAA